MKEKFNNLTKTRQGMVGFFAVLFLVTAFLSFAFFSLSKGGTKSVNVASTRSRIDPNAPKTETCPINGQKYTAAEKSIWEGRRPAAVVVENHLEARPLDGISKADFVYEAVAEGGITRFLAIYYCGTAADNIFVSPPRSARVYYINWASEYGDRPLFVHWGGANDHGENGESKPSGQIDPRVNALGLLEDIGWRVSRGNDIDPVFDSGWPVLTKDASRNNDIKGHDLDEEHTTVLKTDELYTDAEARGLGYTAKNGTKWTQGFISYNFVDDAKVSNPDATAISFDFWSSQPDYGVEWKYDAATNSYKRFNGGEPFIDGMYGDLQITAKNVIVMEVEEEGPVDQEGHMIEDNIGTGSVLVFQNGTVIKGKWNKADRTARTKFTDSSGKEISLVRGVTWVEAIPSDNTVSYN